jgi:hypothetical protein
MGYASDLTDEQWALLEPVFHDRGGPYGRTKGAQRVVAVDVTGLPVGALVVPASAHENRTGEVMLQHLTRQERRAPGVAVDGWRSAGASWPPLSALSPSSRRHPDRDDLEAVFWTTPNPRSHMELPRVAGTRRHGDTGRSVGRPIGRGSAAPLRRVGVSGGCRCSG